MVGGLLLSGCNLAPVYTPTHFLIPDSYQGSEPFRLAQPDLRALSPREDWWKLFQEPDLTRLEEQLERENPSLQAAAEQYIQARDLAAEVQSKLYPQLSANSQLSNNRQSVNRLFRGNQNTPNVQASNELLGSASWEPDFLYEIRNQAHQQERLAQASAADMASARLSLQAELASDYLAIRGLDQQLALLRHSIVEYEKAVNVTHLRLRNRCRRILRRIRR